MRLKVLGISKVPNFKPFKEFLKGVFPINSNMSPLRVSVHFGKWQRKNLLDKIG